MRLHETRLIHRPTEEVFAYTADFSNLERWDPGVSSSTRTDEGDLGVGSTFDVIAVFGSRQVPITYRITEWSPDERVVLVGEGDTLTALDEIVFEDMGDKTLVDYTADLTFRNFMRLLTPFLGPTMDKVGKKALDGLVEALDE